jgi:ESS family glutamate:Na+ symporter
MSNFWDFSVWAWINTFAVLLGSLLVGNMLKRSIPFLRDSLTPTSVIGGIILLIVAAIYKAITGEVMFDTAAFGTNGTAHLEVITYHALALGFIASSFKTTNSKLTKKRSVEIFNTGVTTVSTYLLQGILGLGITILCTFIIKDFFAAAGVLLPFGYGQGTGQALNYGTIYEVEHGFVGGKSFGLTIAALGFLSASIGGVVHLNVMKKRGRIVLSQRSDGSTHSEEVDPEGEIPLQESIDKFTVQVALIIVAYVATYLLMFLLGNLLPGMRSVIYGFNFLLGVLTATIIKLVMNFLHKKQIIHRRYTNNFLMTRASNFFFDLMVVAGVAAIRLDILESSWGIILIIGAIGAISTFIYNRIVAKKLFPDYYEEQFLMMYGMLTGTASTGIILLREIDGEFKTPASDNMVFQNFPAIVFGFPMMFLATFAMDNPVLTLVIFAILFAVMNLLLFRKFIFPKMSRRHDSDEALINRQ